MGIGNERHLRGNFKGRHCLKEVVCYFFLVLCGQRAEWQQKSILKIAVCF